MTAVTTKQTRPGVGTVAGADNSLAAEPIVPEADTAGMAPRARCARCSHPLDAPRSLARGLGPVCWSRTALGQLDARRDAVGRSLAALARRVASADARSLACLSAAIEDAFECLDVEGVAR